ncbi:hypothetical protein RND71_004677 [Anisodus tanguticus]|uniref:Uncharacterized protein n=1 Tax=Anisodus tanguticus TaxID=243964 RepID=A0AAE1SQJ4_9SOLA|nr:hypothetical protein RND71_004677 [Anisodus tanguticus]
MEWDDWAAQLVSREIFGAKTKDRIPSAADSKNKGGFPKRKRTPMARGSYPHSKEENMKVYAIVFIVIASVAFTACNLLCCLCTGRGGRFKKPKLGPDDVETGTKKATTRDGNMVVLAGSGGAATAVTSNDKRARDHKKNTNSGGCGAAVGGGCGGGCGGCGG